MESASIKNKLFEYIQQGDERLLKLMYAVAREYTEAENREEYELTKEQIQELDRRRQAYTNGTSKGYSWTEAKKMITEAKRSNEL